MVFAVHQHELAIVLSIPYSFILVRSLHIYILKLSSFSLNFPSFFFLWLLNFPFYGWPTT